MLDSGSMTPNDDDDDVGADVRFIFLVLGELPLGLVDA